MNASEISFSHPHDHFNQRHVAAVPNTCFVLMPFSKQFTIVWDTIQRALRGLMVCKRADDLPLGHPILERILNGIRGSELIIADLTGRNANVFYELGIAHVQTKSVLLLAQSISDVPFDLRSLHCKEYSITSNAGLKHLAITVRQAAEHARQRSVPEMLQGVQDRTKQIVDYMKRELQTPERLRKMIIRIQAGFSSLSNVDHASHPDPATRDYGKLLVQECEFLEEMLRHGATLQAIIYPPMGPWKRGTRWWNRYEKLLAFMRNRTDLYDRCEFVFSNEEGTNLLFFGEDILFEGHKTGIEGGYGWTMVYTDKRFLKTRLTIFDMLFQDARRYTLGIYGKGKKATNDRNALRAAAINAVELARDGKLPPRWVGVMEVVSGDTLFHPSRQVGTWSH